MREETEHKRARSDALSTCQRSLRYFPNEVAAHASQQRARIRSMLHKSVNVDFSFNPFFVALLHRRSLD